MNRKFFVYGSLMEGLFNFDKYLKGKVRTRKYARTKGELYHLTQKGYPAMIEGDDYIYGELIEVKDFDDTLKSLDYLENFYGDGNSENEYNRKLIKVELLDDGSEEIAYAYIFNVKDIEKLRENNPYIGDGIWRKFRCQHSLRIKALA